MEAVSVNTYNRPPSSLHTHPTFVLPSRFLPASKSGIWGQTCWLWRLYAHKYISLPPLCIILLLLSSAPLTPTFHQAPSTSCDWGLFSMRPANLHKKTRILYCTKKPVSSHTRKDKNSKKKNLCNLWNVNIFIHTVIWFIWLTWGSICCAEMFSSSNNYREPFESFQFPTYFFPLSASTNIDL